MLLPVRGGGASLRHTVCLGRSASTCERCYQLLQFCAHSAVVFAAQITAQLHSHVACDERRRDPERFTNQPFAAIAVDCARCHLTSGDDSNACMTRFVSARAHNKVAACNAQPASQNSLELAAFAQHARSGADRRFDQTAKRARPLARRAFSTARPALVFMRARKPCVRLRRVLEGWYVRFMLTALRPN